MYYIRTMQFRRALFEWDDQQASLYPGRSASFDAVFADFQCEPASDGQRYTLFIHPKKDIVVRRLVLEFDVSLPPGSRFLTNGWQSWSETRLLPPGTGIPVLRAFARTRLQRSGDEWISMTPRGKDVLHSWTYTSWMTDTGHWLCGSLNEHTAFTLMHYDHRSGTLCIEKDVSGLTLGHSFPALDIWTGFGDERGLFDRYFALMELPALPDAGGLGWTSWYRYFNRISEQTLLQQLESVAASGLPFRWFQIDDGWQTAVGDWLSVKPEFPGGMGRMARDIREKGLEPGLWLAPFVASARSELVARHPDWLLRDADGKPLRAGWSPLWGGWYYALDFYQKGVQEYLSGVFHIALEQWGFGLLKLDFLFAACLAPPPGKTRGQVMHEVMAFLRHQMGRRRMLACGVPLGAAFGHADYCRVGGDVHLSWEHRLLAWLRFRERVSTLASLRSTLSRWHLNGRAFHSDPDVFILRKNEQHLTEVQQHTLLTVNALLGGVLFTSDDPSAYTPAQRAALEAALDLQGVYVHSVDELRTDVFRIDFWRAERHWKAWVNLRGETVRPEPDVQLGPYETKVLEA